MSHGLPIVNRLNDQPQTRARRMIGRVVKMDGSVMAEQDKTLRIIYTLQLLTSQRPRTADDLQKALEERGHPVSKRTIERDLQALMASPILGPSIECNEQEKPYGWKLKRDAGLILPQLDIDLAATWDLVGHYLEYLLPDTARHKLNPEIKRARRYLDHHTKSTWNRKVAFLPRGILKPARILPAVREAVYDALVEGSQVQVVYRNKVGEKREARLHPLGIVHRVTVSYLVAMWNDYSDPRHLAFHRIERAQKLANKARRLNDFDLHEHIQTGVFDISAGSDTLCSVKLRFYNGAGEHLLESPIEEEQVFTRVDDNTVDLTVTTHDSYEFRWWILGFGAHVEVLEPSSLRQTIGEQLAEAAARY